MSVLRLPFLYAGSRGEKYLYTLLDSGASLSCIHPDCLEGLADAFLLGRPRYIITASDEHRIEVKEATRIDFYINDVLVSDEFIVVPGLTEQVVIGATTMQKWRIKLDFEHDTVHVDPKVAKMQLI